MVPGALGRHTQGFGHVLNAAQWRCRRAEDAGRARYTCLRQAKTLHCGVESKDAGRDSLPEVVRPLLGSGSFAGRRSASSPTRLGEACCTTVARETSAFFTSRPRAPSRSPGYRSACGPAGDRRRRRKVHVRARLRAWCGRGSRRDMDRWPSSLPGSRSGETMTGPAVRVPRPSTEGWQRARCVVRSSAKPRDGVDARGRRCLVYHLRSTTGDEMSKKARRHGRAPSDQAIKRVARRRVRPGSWNGSPTEEPGDRDERPRRLEADALACGGTASAHGRPFEAEAEEGATGFQTKHVETRTIVSL